MDLSSVMNIGNMSDNMPKNTPEQKQSSLEYTAQAVSPVVNGEVKLTVAENSFTATALFDVAEIAFVTVTALEFADYVVTVKTEDGDYAFSKMGQWAEPFYNALCDAYNKATVRAFFVSGNPLFKASGNYRFTENGVTVSGAKADIHVYENCIIALPPNGNSRRIPLCFTVGMDKGDYQVTFKLLTGETYTFSKMGYDTVSFIDAAEKQIRALREKALSTVKSIDPTLTAPQTSQIAKIMPEGAAAQFGQLTSISTSFTEALESKISQTRADEYYRALKEMCDHSLIYVGAVNGEYWLIAPSPDGQYATVEFSEGDTATFVYKTGGNFSAFAAQINRALEAISFKMEVIRLTGEDIRKPENADYYMAEKRTSALQFVRSHFTGRVIHSGAETWKRKLTELWI